MGSAGAPRNGNGELSLSGIPVGSKIKYQRMDSTSTKDSDDASHHNHQEDRSRRTRKYVFVCAVFASLNNALLGYGMLFSVLYGLSLMFVSSLSCQTFPVLIAVLFYSFTSFAF